MKEDFDTLQEALLEHKLPLTIKMGNLSNLVQDVLTLQHRRRIIQLEFLKANGKTSFLPITEESAAMLLMIDHSESYRTIEELRANKKKKKIQWFITTKEFGITNRFFNMGHIFMFAPSSLLRSFRRGKKRGIYVLSYPTMEKHFIPMDVEAYFYKCECPSTWKTYKTSELIKMRNFPYLLSFQVNSQQIRDGTKTSNMYFVLNIREIDIFYASKKICGMLHLHTFAAHAPSVVNVQLSAKLIDALSNNELSSVVRTIALPLDTDLRYFIDIRSYKDLGIIRLVDEMTSDNNSDKSRQLSRIHSERRTNRNKITDNIRKQFSFTGIRSPLTNRKSVDCNALGRRKIYEEHDPYVNHRTIRSNSEPVDFDDSGYVIVPLSRHGSDSKENETREFTDYKCRENPEYNYQFQIDNETDNHLYTYVYALNNTKSDDKNNNMYINGHNTNQDDVVYKSINSLDDQLDVCKDNDDSTAIYNYSHITQCHLSKQQRKRRMRELNVDEVIDLLKIANMKHHIEQFRQNSISGSKLSEYCEKDLTNLDLTRFEALKLICFMDGWTPLRKSTSGEGWLGNMVCDWNLNDVSKYLFHIRMRPFQQFCTKHEVDGYLLNKLIISDVIDSLREQHDVIMKEKNVNILKDYVKKDEQPRFQFVER